MNLPSAFYFTDENRTHSALETIARLAANTGVIYRHYAYPNRQELGAEIVEICRKKDLFLAVAEDPSLANALKAPAVHLPERLISKLPLIRKQYPKLLISCACHNALSLKAANNLGADLAFLSPIYPTASHPNARTLGSVEAAIWIKDITIPVYALGGIEAHHINQLKMLGFAGFGAISLFD